MFCEQTPKDDGKEKLPFNQKKHPAESDTGVLLIKSFTIRKPGGILGLQYTDENTEDHDRSYQLACSLVVKMATRKL